MRSTISAETYASRRPASRWMAMAGAFAGAVAMAAAVPGAGAAGGQSQPLVTDVVKKSGITFDSQSSKQAFAYCDPGQVVVGGGGWAFVPGSADDPNAVTLFQLQPATSLNGSGRQGYAAGAAEAGPGVSGEWWVEAYALCADPITGHRIVASPTVSNTSDPVQKADAVCAAGEKVLGTGARVLNTSTEVGLQVARADALGVLTRAQAHEDANGFSGSWSLKAYAICARQPQGYEVRTGESSERGSEPIKDAHASCSTGKRMISTGAAISNVAPGNVSLQVLYPTSGGRSMDAYAVENTPLFDSWDFIIARGICVTEG